MLIIHNEELLNLARSRYNLSDVKALWDVLLQKKTLTFPTLDNGLFPAAVVDDKEEEQLTINN